jgi:hypothetical protein
MPGIGQLIADLSALVPPWVLWTLALVLLVVAVPGYQYSIRERQVRERVRRMVRAEPARRAQLVEDALTLAGRNPHLLALVVREARKRTLPLVQDRALAVLDAGDAAMQQEAKRLRSEVAVVDPMLGRPHAMAAAALAMLEAGNPEGARSRVEAALSQHPNDPVLRAAATRIAAEHPQPEAAVPSAGVDGAPGDP